jgi:membrane-associated phospholipid phosphatase
MNKWIASSSLAVVALVSSVGHADEPESAPSGPAYRLEAVYDLPAYGIGIAYTSGRLVRTQKPQCSQAGEPCDKSDLNALDRLTAGWWHPTWATVSDVAVYTMMGLSAGYLFIDENPTYALNDLVVVAESALLSTATATVMTTAVARPRPYVYGSDAPLDTRNSVDATMSFISSHTAIAFGLSTSVWMTYRRLHPKSSAHWALLLIGDAAAAFVGYARVAAGRHFPTDVVTGALVGSSVGALVPAMHGSPVRVVPMVGQDQAGLALVGAL